jgi:hypothetical protein
MAKRKPGLHKPIPSIFDGVPNPNEKDGDIPSSSEDSANSSPGQGSSRSDYSHQSKINPAVKGVADDHLASKSATRFTASGPERKEKVFKDSEITAFQKSIGKFGKGIRSKLFASQKGISPARQAATFIIFTVLLVIAVIVVFNAFKTSSRTPALSDNVGSANAAANNSQEQPKINWQRPESYSLSRDPMKRGYKGQYGKSGTGEVVIIGIVGNEEAGFTASLADGTMIKEGEEIFGFKVLNITIKSVEFEKDGRRWNQKIQDGNEKE